MQELATKFKAQRDMSMTLVRCDTAVREERRAISRFHA